MKSNQPVYLVVDLGAESGRVMAVRVVEGTLELLEMQRFSNGPVQVFDSQHWDILHLWRNIKAGIRRAAAQFGDNIVSIAVDTWGVDFGLFSEDGRLMQNPRHYRDHRTDGMMEKAFEKVARKDIFAATGIQFMQLNTLYQLLAMREEGDVTLDRANKLLPMPDIFNYWLTGKMKSEFTMASTTQCFNPVTDDWAWDLLKEMGIPTSIFPEIIKPGNQVGTLLPTLAAELGLPQIPVIAVGCHDTASAVAAAPLADKNSIYLSSGTWSLMGVEVAQPVITPESLAYNFTNEGGVADTFRLLKNISGLWLVQECRRIWTAAAQTEISYAELTDRAAAATSCGAIINPGDTRFLAPAHMPEEIENYCRETGQKAPEGQGETVRCVLESLALEYRWVANCLQELTGHAHAQINIIGGGSKNTLLNQLTADVTGMPVYSGPVEATAIGSALLQMQAHGTIKTIQQGREMVGKSFPAQIYKPIKNKNWDAAFAAYARLRQH